MKKLYILGVLLLLTFSFQTVHASPFPVGCTATTKFSATTGHACVPQACQQGDLYNSETGQPCSTTNSPSLVAGCNNTAGFSNTTGAKCDGSVPASAIQNITPIDSYGIPINPATVTSSCNQNNIADLTKQITTMRSTAIAQENAYHTGTLASFGQALANKVAQQEAINEELLDQQLQAAENSCGTSESINNPINPYVAPVASPITTPRYCSTQAPGTIGGFGSISCSGGSQPTTYCTFESAGTAGGFGSISCH